MNHPVRACGQKNEGEDALCDRGGSPFGDIFHCELLNTSNAQAEDLAFRVDLCNGRFALKFTPSVAFAG